MTKTGKSQEKVPDAYPGNTGKGKEGEEKAAIFLESKGMKIIARNVRVRKSVHDCSLGDFRGGEIDIIALDGETIVFVEVKRWSFYSIESLEQGINKKKQSRIIETAKYFLLQNRKYRYMAVRFDVVFIAPHGVTHLASAFTEYV